MTDQRTRGATVRVAVIGDSAAQSPPGTARTEITEPAPTGWLPGALIQLRECGVPGYTLDLAPTSAEFRYDLVHVVGHGAAADAAVRAAQTTGVPVVTGYREDTPADTAAALHAASRLVLSPSRGADLALELQGVSPQRIARWVPGVDLKRFHPARYAPEVLPEGFTILCAGPVTRALGVDLLADAFLIAHDRDPRIRLALAGAGPDVDRICARIGAAATVLGALDPDRLAAVYATADLFVFPGTSEAHAHVILEAQASGLPVLALDTGNAAELIENGRSGCLVAPDPEVLGSAISGLARREALRDRLATGGLIAVRQRSWEHSIAQLAEAYGRALTGLAPPTEGTHTALGAEVARAA